LETSWQSFPRLQHSEQITPWWKGQPATSGRSNASAHTMQVSVTADSYPSTTSSSVGHLIDAGDVATALGEVGQYRGQHDADADAQRDQREEGFGIAPKAL
jgi:hypothetical protein